MPTDSSLRNQLCNPNCSKSNNCVAGTGKSGVVCLSVVLWSFAKSRYVDECRRRAMARRSSSLQAKEESKSKPSTPKTGDW